MAISRHLPPHLLGYVPVGADRTTIQSRARLAALSRRWAGLPDRRTRWQDSRRDAGDCMTCGQPRGTTGTTRLCRPCATVDSQRKALDHAAHLAAGRCPCGRTARHFRRCRYCRQRQATAARRRYHRTTAA